MREIEVLYDQLLDIMSKNKELQPRHFLVMAPDINLYLPYIHAVFDDASVESQKIPYTIADQRMFTENPIGEAFVTLLELFLGSLLKRQK